jgi:hypothetical protein
MRRSAGDRVSLGHIRAVELRKPHETDPAFIIWTGQAERNAGSVRLLRLRRMDSEVRRYADEKKRRSPEGTALVVTS